MLILIATFLNPWIFYLFKNKPLIAICLIALSLISIKIIQKPQKKLTFLLFCLTFTLFLVIFTSNFKKTDWQYTPTEEKVVTPRHNEFTQGLGAFYTNKLSLKYTKDIKVYIEKYIQNTIENLDPNLFFLSSHPRERPGVYEFEKYWIIFLPFFILGFFDFLKRPGRIFSLYIICIIFLSGFISRNYSPGPVFYFPVMNTFIFLGLEKVLKLIKK